MNSTDVVIKSLFYKFLERFGSFSITFIVQLVLARLLTPKDFGIVAILTVFINIAQVFVQSGFSTSLIQKKE
ncbi:oligosaccharide flippase family protein [Enterococcus gallinarum]|nr:oligosaccharide flippase family protein [Enterococcus gallinarum]